jgi:transglutaminase-like putative cysteine protease
MKIAVRHELTFSLGTPARAVVHLLLTPLATPQQRVERWSIDMPGIKDAASFRDGFGNRAHLVSLSKPEPNITVLIEGVVETIDKSGVIGRLDLDPMPALYRRPTAATKADPSLIEGLAPGGRIAMLHQVMGRVHERRTQSQAQGDQNQSQSSGPSDGAQSFIGAARALDIPARHVSGYLLTEDGGQFHSWAEAWDDGLGWIGFDPLLNQCPAEDYVRLASGLDAAGTVAIRTVPAWTEMPVEVVSVSAV